MFKVFFLKHNPADTRYICESNSNKGKANKLYINNDFFENGSRLGGNFLSKGTSPRRIIYVQIFSI